jgi:HlyD family secretion protein
LVGLALLAALLWALLRQPAVTTELAKASRGPMQVTIDNLGQLRAVDRYSMTAPVAAEVQRIALREGDPVKRGQEVATLDLLPMDERQRQEARARLEAARARQREAAVQIRRAQTELDLANSELARTERLVASRFIAPQAGEKARAAAITAGAELKAADSREQAALADVQVARSALLAAGPDSAMDRRAVRLLSPVDGFVLRIPERSERSVAAGTVLMTIGDPQRFEIVVDVLSTDAVKITPGQTMLLEGWGGGKTLRARVRLVEPVAFTKISALGVEEQRVNVVADPVDALGRLGDGYRVEARVVVWSSPDAMKVPASSLFRVGNAWHVFAVNAGRLHSIPVTVGQRNRDEAEILGGLPATAEVVRYPASQMKDGMRASASDR